MHDHWKPYYTLTGVVHALCNAHHLRELKALVEIEKEDWAGKMQRLLRRACHAANLARERDKPVPPRLIALFERRYDATVTEGLAFHEAQPALVRPANAAGANRAGWVTTCCCALAHASRMCSASCPIPQCGSPTTWPNATAG